MANSILQFKRVFNYEGSMDSALENIKSKLNLQEGEPLICSYKEDNIVKYFMAIGADNGSVVVYPTFSDQSEFIAFIRKYAGSNLIDMISDESDFYIELDSNNKYIFKIKENVLANFN